mgnify:CR=1 FL=1
MNTKTTETTHNRLNIQMLEIRTSDVPVGIAVAHRPQECVRVRAGKDFFDLLDVHRGG